MTRWPHRLRGALGMGLSWAVAWAVFGVALGVASVVTPWLSWDRLFAVYDAPLPTLALPGFVGGVLFALVLGVAARGRRLDELSMPAFAAWGAIGGLLLALVPALLVGVGMATIPALWPLTALVAGPFALLGAASAAASLGVARAGARRAALAAGGTDALPAPSVRPAGPAAAVAEGDAHRR